MCSPAIDLVMLRLAIFGYVATLKGEEEWSEENLTAAVYLFSAVAAEGTLFSARMISGLDKRTCDLYANRMKENGMVAAELDYRSDQSGIEADLDTLVLMGLMSRTRRGDGLFGYTNTPAGNRKALALVDKEREVSA